jgi:glycosyltransferase involved in cell wall biosynthesis
MVDEPLRICLLSYRGNPRSGGQGIYVRLLSKELAAMGHEIDVWSGPPYPEIVPGSGVHLEKIPSLDLWNDEALFRTPSLAELKDPINRYEWIRTLLGGFVESRTFTWRVDGRLKQMGDAVPYDIFHDNQCLGMGLLEVQKRHPIIATIHHPITRDFKVAMESMPWWNLYRKFGLHRWYTSFLPEQIDVARKLERIMTISQASTDDIVDDFGIDRERVRMVGNGINLAVFEPRPEIERRENRLITTLSADVPLKGVAFLLEAFAVLRRERPELHLTVIGTPRKQSDTADRVKRLGIEDAVEFTGRVTADEIARRYAESTCAVVSSLYEGFGFPAGEAMACEVPLVSTRGGALPEVVGESGNGGILVEPGCANALADGIRTVLDATPDERRRMGRAGRERVLEHFSWRGTAERTVECYRELIAERAHARGERRVEVSVPAAAAAAVAAHAAEGAASAGVVANGNGRRAGFGGRRGANGNGNGRGTAHDSLTANGNGKSTNGNGIAEVAAETTLRVDDRA